MSIICDELYELAKDNESKEAKELIAAVDGDDDDETVFSLAQKFLEFMVADGALTQDEADDLMPDEVETDGDTDDDIPEPDDSDDDD